MQSTKCNVSRPDKPVTATLLKIGVTFWCIINATTSLIGLNFQEHIRETDFKYALFWGNWQFFKFKLNFSILQSHIIHFFFNTLLSKYIDNLYSNSSCFTKTIKYSPFPSEVFSFLERVKVMFAYMLRHRLFPFQYDEIY